jgi:hypothetical protein
MMDICSGQIFLQNLKGGVLSSSWSSSKKKVALHMAGAGVIASYGEQVVVPAAPFPQAVYTSAVGNSIHAPLRMQSRQQGRVWRSRSSKGILTTANLQMMRPGENVDQLVKMPEILAAAREKGVIIELKTLGPLFSVTAKDTAGENNLGSAHGIIRPWLPGKVLHLDSMRLEKASTTRSNRSIFGIGVLLGAVMVRHGIDMGCCKGELLAINDGDVYHTKLVRYYSRLGWRVVYEVRGESWRDFVDMLVWGGVGTRMDAELSFLLAKWATTLTPKSATKDALKSNHAPVAGLASQ